jgi:WD40 repeat protein
MRQILLTIICFVSFQWHTTAQNQQDNTAHKKCNFKLSEAFRNYSDADCYAITVTEAERAFRQGCWDEAERLFRAAKNCSDTDPTRSRQLNQRIADSQKAAEDELLNEREKARREARQSEATNRANDASRLLEEFDRTRAFRLADFANEYIAPNKDNPACLQTIIDAWNYDPSIHSDYNNSDSKLSVPFTYELVNDLGQGVQIRFMGVGVNRKLLAWVPSRNQLLSWRIHNFKAEKPIQLDSTIQRIDVSPDEKTIALYSEDKITLWRGTRKNENHTFNIQATHYYFDESGERFFYYIPTERTIYQIAVNEIFNAGTNNVSRSGKRIQAAARPVAKDIDSIIGLSYYDGYLWFATPQTLKRVQPGGDNTGYMEPEVFTIDGTPKDAQIATYIFPKNNAFIICSNSQTYVYTIDVENKKLLYKENISGIPLGFEKNGDWHAILTYNQRGLGSRLGIWPLMTLSSHYGVSLNEYDSFSAFSGTFGMDDDTNDKDTATKWFAAVTPEGAIRVWELSDTKRTDERSLEKDYAAVFDPSGDQLMMVRRNRATIMPISQNKTSFITAQIVLADTTNYSIEYNAANAYLFLTSSWAGIRSPDGFDTITLVHLSSPMKRYKIKITDPYPVQMAIDPTSKYAAYTSGDSVHVVLLDTIPGPRRIASHIFGQDVIQLAFIPGQTRLVVCPSFSEGASFTTFSRPQIWDFMSPSANTQSVRISQTASKIDLHPRGTEIAIAESFVQGRDVIRIFDLNNLVDESVNIRATGDRYISALRYHPNGKSIAAGYNDGSIELYNTNNGQQIYQIGAPPVNNADSLAVRDIVFAQKGDVLRALHANGSVQSHDLNPTDIRRQLTATGRPLVAFSPNQISDWGLDRALDYDDNFQQLATCGDAPLIRAFFEFYAMQARSSNNITLVERYCDRARALYNSSLDAATQRALTPVLLEMYADYCWRLIERNQPDRAEAEANQITRLAGRNSLRLMCMKAHASLLRHNLPQAAKRYVEWRIAESMSDPMDESHYYYHASDVNNDINLLEAYNLLDDRQRDLVCGLFGSLCPTEAPASYQEAADRLPLSYADALMWRVFRFVEMLDFDYSREYDIQQNLTRGKANIAAATELRQLKPTEGQTLYERSVLLYARYLSDNIQLENGAHDEIQTYCQQGIQLLSEQSAFSYHNELDRLYQLTSFHAVLANSYLHNDPKKTLEYADAGVQVFEKFEETLTLKGDNLNDYREAIIGQLYTIMGQAELITGDADAARISFESANFALQNGLNPWYMGHAELLDEAFDEARIYYDGASNDEYLSNAIAEILQLAEYHPDKAMTMRKFANNIRSELTQKYKLDSLLIETSIAERMTGFYADRKQYDKAYKSAQWATQSAQKVKKNENLMVNVQLNLAYYGIIYQHKNTAAIGDLLEKTQKIYADNNYDYTANRYLIPTNLGHFYLLLGQPDKAKENYQLFINADNYRVNYNRRMLYKDWRELYKAGVVLPGLASIWPQLWPPDAPLTAEELRLIGL